MKKKWLSILIIGALLVVLAACGGQTATTKPSKGEKTIPKKMDTVKVGTLNTLSNASMYIGAENGIFKKYGINLQFESFKGSQPLTVAVQTGAVDVGSSAFTAGLFNLLSEGDSPIRIVADGTQERKGYHASALIVRKNLYDSGVKTIKDLKGKKVGITQNGASIHYMVGKALETGGISLKDVEETPLESMGNIASALQSGKIDAASLPSTLVETLVAKNQVKVIAWVGDLVNMQVAGVYFSGNLMKNNDLAVRFLEGYIESVRYYYNNVLNPKDKNTKEYNRNMETLAKYTNIPKDSVSANLNYIDKNAKFWTDDLKTWSDWYLKNGLIRKPIDTNKVVDTKFYNEAFNLVDKK